MSDLIWALVLSSILVLAMIASNIAYNNLHWPFYLSRKLIHFGSAIPIILLPVVYKAAIYPLLLVLIFLVILAISRPLGLFPGFSRRGRLSEIYFALGALMSIIYLWPRDPWLAIVPMLFLALGDGITGVIRMVLHKQEIKGWWGSLGCFFVCGTVAAFLVYPLWLGLVAAGASTLAERFCGDARGSVVRIDDNLAMPVTAIAVFYLGYIVW